MRRITPLAPVALSLLALTLGATSCKKNKVELEDIQIFDNEIKAFALSTDDAALKEAVSTIPFVIRNTATGFIYNLHALPYSSTDYNVHLRLMKASDQSSVEVILSNGTAVKWTGETQTFKSSDLLKGIQLRITTGTGNASSSSYTYKVTFKRYAQDPHAFAWSEASVTGLPAFSTSFSQVELRGKDAGGALYYVTADGKNAVSTFSDPTGTWTPASLSGLTEGEHLTSLLTYGEKLYATTSADHLYEASTFGTAFTAKTFPATATPHALLGGLNLDGKPALALVGKTTSGAMNFVRYDLTSGQIRRASPRQVVRRATNSREVATQVPPSISLEDARLTERPMPTSGRQRMGQRGFGSMKSPSMLSLPSRRRRLMCRHRSVSIASAPRLRGSNYRFPMTVA